MPDSSTFTAYPAPQDAAVVPAAHATDTQSLSPVLLRDAKIIDRVRLTVRAHRNLGVFESAIRIAVENTVVVLRGKLPTQDLKNQLNLTVRQAGILLRIDNQIEVLSE